MLKLLMSFLTAVISLFVSLFVYYNNTHYGYDHLWLLPFTYSINVIIYFFILRQKLNIFTFLLNIVLFSRYVLLSFLLAFTNLDVNRSLIPPLDSSYNYAVSLMTIEMIIIFLVVYLLFSRIKLRFQKVKLLDKSDMRVYLLFICASFLAFLIQPGMWDSVSFLIPNEKEINTDSSNVLTTITFFSLNLSRYLLIIIITSKLYSLYKNNGKKISILLLNYIIALVLCLVMFGHNRADFLIPFLSVLFVLYLIYEKRGAILSIISIMLAPIALNFITLSRSTVSADNSLPFWESWTMMLQVYLGGVYNVAIAIETKELFSEQSTFFNLLFDIFRPFLGINVFIQGMDYKLVNHLFNYRIYGSEHVSQIMPSVGQGYFFFGFIFAPLFTVFMLFIAYLLLKVIVSLKRIDLLLILLIPTLRLTLSSVQNISIIINDITSILMIFIPIYIITRKIKLQKE